MSDVGLESGATAWQAWDERWRTPEGRARWLAPEPEVRDLATMLARRGGRAVLDLGCGVGRHAIHMARAGFAASAMDAAPAGLAYAREWARRDGLALDLRIGQMTSLPFDGGAFDAVIAWNVIYHGDPEVVNGALGEIRRVLRPGGLYLGTFLSKRHIRHGQGRLIARDTYVIDGEAERDHPHHYCEAQGVLDFMRGLTLWSLVDREHEGAGTYHWHVLAERDAD